MRLYDNAYGNYEELKTYYPVWYRDVLEMDALWRVLGGQLDQVQDGILQVIANNFIRTSDEYGISQLEKFLFIPYDGGRTLEDRKTLVSSFFVGNGHMGEWEIKEIVKGFTPSPCSVSLNGGTVSLSIERDQEDHFMLSDCYFILLKKIPAHLGLLMTVVNAVDTGFYVGCHVSQYKEILINGPVRNTIELAGRATLGTTVEKYKQEVIDA